MAASNPPRVLNDINGSGAFVDDPGANVADVGADVVPSTFFYAGLGTDTVTGGTGALTVYADHDANSLDVDGGAGTLLLRDDLAAGNVTVTGAAGGATIFGGAGNNIEITQAGALALHPSNGIITVIPDGTDPITVYAADGSGAYVVPQTNAPKGTTLTTYYNASSNQTDLTDQAGGFVLAGGAWLTADQKNGGVLTTPNVPVILQLPDAVSDTGWSSVDGLTDNQSPLIQGTVVNAGDEVVVLDNGTAIGTAVAVNNYWSLAAPGLRSGENMLVAEEVTQGVTLQSAPVALTIDNNAPALPTIEAATPLQVTGAADAGDRVVVFDATIGAVVGTIVADASDAWTLTPSTALGTGDVLNVTVTSLSGETVSATGAGTVAAVMAALDPNSAASSNPMATDQTTPLIDILAGPSEAVSISDARGLLATGATGASGTVTLAVGSPLAIGTDTLTIAAGGTSTTLSVTVDPVPPTPTIALDPSDASPLSAVDTIKDAPIFDVNSGTDSVSVAIDGQSIGDLPQSGTAMAPGSLTPGFHVITAQAADGDGNVSAIGTLVVTIDPVPSVTNLGLTPGEAAPSRASDGSVVTDATSPTVTGTAGVTGTIVVGNGIGQTVTQAVTGGEIWSATLQPLPVGAEYALSVTPYDSFGDAGPVATVPIDVVPVPVVAGITLTANDGFADHTISQSPTLTGKAAAGETVTFTGIPVSGAVLTDKNGSWAVTPSVALAPGVYTVTAAATDAFGDVGPSATYSFTVDPAATTPTVALGAGSRSGIPVPNRTDVARPVFAGTADPGAIVTVNDGAVAHTATADASGAWSTALGDTLAPGDYGVMAFATDPTGSISQVATLDLTIDPVPTTPTAALLADETDGAPDHTMNASPVLSGTSDPGDSIAVTIDGSVMGTAAADASGAWSISPQMLGVGQHVLTATATNALGDVSATGTYDFAVDAIPTGASPPSVPTIGLAQGSDTGVTGDDRTTDTMPTLIGTVDVGDVVTVTIDGNTSPASVTSAGVWSLAARSLTLGTHAVVVTATDPVTGLATSSTPIDILIDPVPSAPMVGLAVGQSDGAADHTMLRAPTLSGTADPGDVVVLTLDGTPAGSVTAGAHGSWTATLSALALGTHTVAAIASDSDGNESAATDLVLTVDPTLSTPTFSILAAPAGTTTTNYPKLAGIAPGADRVTLLDSGMAIGAASVAGDGSFTINPALAPGRHELTIVAADQYGDVATSAPVTLTVAPPNLTLGSDLPPDAAAALSAAIPSLGSSPVTFITPGAPVPGSVSGSLGLAIGSSQDGSSVTVGAGTPVVTDDADAAVTIHGGSGAKQVLLTRAPAVTFLTDGGSGTFIDDAPDTQNTPPGTNVIFTPSTGAGRYSFIGAHGNNVFVLASGNNTVDAGTGNNVSWLGSGSNLVVSRGHDTVIAGAGAVTVDASAGTGVNPLVFGGSGNLTFTNGAGSATVASGAGSTTAFGGAGSVAFFGGSGGGNLLVAGQKASELFGVSGGSVLFANGAGSDTLAGGAGNETLVGGAATGNSVFVTGGSADVVFAGRGNDSILASTGHSTIYAGAGDDTILANGTGGIVAAGTGDSTIIGGGGPEIYGFDRGQAGGATQITHFTPGKDTLELWNYGAGEIVQAVAGQVSRAGSTTLTLSDGTRITLIGVEHLSAGSII